MTCHASRAVITLNHPYAGVVVAYIKKYFLRLVAGSVQMLQKNGPIGLLLFVFDTLETISDKVC